MEIESEQRTIVIHRPDPAVLQRAAIVEAGFAKAPAKRRIILPRWKMRFDPGWSRCCSALRCLAQQRPSPSTIPCPIQLKCRKSPARRKERCKQPEQFDNFVAKSLPRRRSFRETERNTDHAFAARRRHPWTPAKSRRFFGF